MKKLLPVGSIVKVRDSEKLFMIASFMVTTTNDKKYDYLAVRYPYGFIDDKCFYSFDQSNIDEVVHMGYESETHTNCIALLDTLNELSEEGNGDI